MKLWLVIAIVVAIYQCQKVTGCGGGGGGGGGGDESDDCGGVGYCYETWIKCTAASDDPPGIPRWPGCNVRCVELGHSGGTCKRCPSKCPLTSKPWQCGCN